ncbi:MAG: hypothetical protein GXO76_12585 [Calditrichaeota bacterium]|nr:hypothetical protein [Calditrichota bacterium]
MKSFLADFWNLIRKHYRFLVMVFLIIFGVLVFVDLGFYTSSVIAPKTCAVCHYETSVVNRWENSYHADVSCSKCHTYSPGTYIRFIWKYWTGTYRFQINPHISDQSCLKCHGEEILKKKITYKRDIKFDHTQHIGRLARNTRLHCSSCHNFTSNQSHLDVNEETCFLCHFKNVPKGQAFPGCPSCHGTPKKIIHHSGFVFDHKTYVKAGITCNECHVDVASGTGNVPRERCRHCHVERFGKITDAEFIHEKHVTENDFDCNICHTAIKHGDIKLVNTLDVKCSSCHQTTHSAKKEMYMGAGGKDVPDTPSEMFLAQVSCEGCHSTISSEYVKSNAKSSLVQKKKACLRCHGGQYDKMLDNWIINMNRLVKEMQPKISKVGRLVSAASRSGRLNNEIEKKYVQKLYNDASYNFNFVKNGKGVHNIFYAVKLLKSTKSNLEAVSKELHAPPPKFRDPILTTPDAFCSAFCHNIVKPPDRIMFEQMDFPHNKHVKKVGLECTVCHSPERHKQRIISKQECMNCHHKDENANCATCHVYQTELYSGEVKEAGITDEPDVMYAAEIGCTDCHNLEDKREPLISVAENCVACHEEGYDQTLRKWHNDLQDRLIDVFMDLQGAETYLRRANLQPEERKKREALLKSAQKMYTVLNKGKPVHNPDVSEEIMDKIEALIKKVGYTRPKISVAK